MIFDLSDRLNQKVVFLWIVELKKICAFFGHRRAPSYLYQNIKLHIEKLITTQSVECFWVGGYGDFDRMASRAVRELKVIYSHIRLILILAYLPTKPQKDIAYLYRLYDDLFYPEGLEFIPFRLAILKRNEWMAKNCDVVIGFVANNYGGAYKAISIAKQQHKNIINLIQ